MSPRRLVASLVLTALLGGLALPWIGETHQFNDDPHWAVAFDADHGEGPVWNAGTPGDDTHCEVCHWLRTMRTASRPAQVQLFRDARLVVPLATPDPDTRAASLRALSARAPPV